MGGREGEGARGEEAQAVDSTNKHDMNRDEVFQCWFLCTWWVKQECHRNSKMKLKLLCSCCRIKLECADCDQSPQGSSLT